MLHTSTTYPIHRSAELVSTAIGYDVIVWSRGDTIKVRRHANVTAASMRRYYRLSNRWSDYQSTKFVSYPVYRKLIPEEHI